MFNDPTPAISRHADGSIDYAHYAARASIARNSEFKRMLRATIESRAPRSSLLSVLTTLVLLALIF